MASFQHIRPRYKLILFYNIKRDKQDQYYRYMLSSFVPDIQKLGVYMHMVWHVAYGEYPMRKIEFVTESADILRRLFLSDLMGRFGNQTTAICRRLRAQSCRLSHRFPTLAWSSWRIRP